MQKLSSLQEQTEEWARVRGFMTDSDPLSQMKKLREEIGESMYGHLIPSFEEERDGLGDTTVVLCIQCWQLLNNYEKWLARGRVVIREVRMEGSITLFMYGQIVQAAERIALSLEENDCEGALEAIGECGAWVEMRAEQIGSNLADSWSEAYDEIKNRKGRMIRGVWVKETER